MKKTVIQSEHAPSPIGCYSQAVRIGNLVFLSGQIALDPKTNEMVTSSFAAEMQQVFSNLEAVILDAGASFAQVAKFTIYLTDLSCFPLVNEYMQKILSAPFPARVTVGVASLPKSASIEVDAILVI
ncbi:Rid family detoxifying hydrolase [Candidatus Berkiella cookevillensis]|uniref:Enamine/imine deaminase n=1 Tax=Candidatus Berkiella cookevillensis TaxID=437022 RepID=A0A0Q9YT45_9GAMM|nr:Rid family detoxifying hydrolase [Candidatus Berkiella cookevillensis]MCS5708408.1 Rid family detoxifying hydrolase [Candidatus Berkiella cookevillensis]